MKLNLIPRRFRNPYVTTVVLIVWCGMFGFYLMDLQTYADAEKWPIVSAELVSGEIEEIKRRRGRSSNYRLNLEYRYEVAGKVYQNDKIQVLDDDFSDRSDAEKALKSYQALPMLTVYYSESNPATSILQPKIPGHSGIFLVLAGVGALVFLGMTILAWIRK